MIEIKTKETFNPHNNGADYVIDVSSNNNIFNPKYPIRNIPIPYSIGHYGFSLFGIWEGLKVFENKDIDVAFWMDDNMPNDPRVKPEYGKLLGFRRGINGHVVFSEEEARRRIYIPTYKWILEYKAYHDINRLRFLARNKTIVLMDDNDNCNIDNITLPLSTAFLLKSYVEGIYPYEDILIEKIKHHYYCSRRVHTWVSIEREFKAIPPKDCNDSQLEIQFDY